MRRFLIWAVIIFLIIAIPTTMAALFTGFVDGLMIIFQNVHIPTPQG
jgi:hypothetical protein